MYLTLNDVCGVDSTPAFGNWLSYFYQLFFILVLVATVGALRAPENAPKANSPKRRAYKNASRTTHYSYNESTTVKHLKRIL
jgi:hypothetical protein